MDRRTECCNDQLLRSMLHAESDDAGHESIIEHVEHCDRCQSRLERLAAGDDDWQDAMEALKSPRTTDRDGSLQERTDHRTAWKGRTIEWTESMVRQLLSPPRHPEMLGRLGRYEIERLIGTGGMGIVLKGFDSELNRPVAIKVLAPYLSFNGSARRRFAREARAAAGIVDENVVPIYNVESESDPPFLVMQCVAGGSLQEKLDRDGPFSPVDVVRIGMQTARGLSAAHAQGLIHRDVKPSNILLDEGVERALLTDFGLARAEDDACLTQSGFHPGTPHYMSPEQIRGETIDARSDLFSLGCVLYALCTGHPPFRAATSYAVLRRITDEMPRPIREINPNVPDWLQQIVERLLAKSTSQRFQSAREVSDLLEKCLAFVQQPSTHQVPECVAEPLPSAERRWRGSLAVAVAFTLVTIISGFIVLIKSNQGTIKIQSELGDVPDHKTSSDSVLSIQIAVPDSSPHEAVGISQQDQLNLAPVGRIDADSVYAFLQRLQTLSRDGQFHRWLRWVEEDEIQRLAGLALIGYCQRNTQIKMLGESVELLADSDAEIAQSLRFVGQVDAMFRSNPPKDAEDAYQMIRAIVLAQMSSITGGTSNEAQIVRNQLHHLTSFSSLLRQASGVVQDPAELVIALFTLADQPMRQLTDESTRKDWDINIQGSGATVKFLKSVPPEKNQTLYLTVNPQGHWRIGKLVADEEVRLLMALLIGGSATAEDELPWDVATEQSPALILNDVIEISKQIESRNDWAANDNSR